MSDNYLRGMITVSENAKKLVDLIVKIIVNATIREVEKDNSAAPIQEDSKVKKSKRGSNKKN